MSAAAHSIPIPADAEARVRGLLSGGLAPAAREEAMAHLRVCDGCAGFYDRVAEAERALLGTRDLLGAAARERIAERLEAPAAAGGGPARVPASSRRRWILSTASASMLLVVAVLGARKANDEWGVRGGHGARASVGIRVFRILESAGAKTSVAEISNAGATPVVASNEQLGFSYTNLGDATYVTWIAVSGSGNRVRLDALSGPVKPGAIDEPFSTTIPAGRFAAGPVTLWAIFSRTPPEADLTREILPVREFPAASQRSFSLVVRGAP